MKKEFNKDIYAFINANLKTDLHSLLLKKSPFPEVSMQEIVQQIKGRKVAEKKFPFFLKEGIVFPPGLNMEQSSSQITAIYKAKNLHGKTFLDLTSGFGIDAFFMSENFEEVTLVEQNAELLEMVRYNWKMFGKPATFISKNALDFLQENTQIYDVVYLDPARRDAQRNKVFLLEDLSPNLLEIQDILRKSARKIIIKLSPLIDVSYLLSVLKEVYRIEIIAVKNEVKEVVVYIHPDSKPEKVSCSCVNLESEEPVFEFDWNQESEAQAAYSVPLSFLYLPNNAVLKSGAFHLIAKRFGLKKLHPNTHLYTSDRQINDFPGRVLEVETVDASAIKKKEQFNIISKNHPLKPEEIKKKFQLKDGGIRYLIFTRSLQGKHILKSK